MSGLFTKFSNFVSDALGRPVAFIVALLLISSWGFTGPIFGYSSVWQLVINTSTTIITFLMLFVLQNTQNRDSKALQTKLDELILESEAENKFVGVERLSDDDLLQMRAQIDARAGAEARDKVSDVRN
jgi:low affinity Fe/Cu permease